MKVIFLDIDGVLNVYRRERDVYGSLFHENFVDNLKTIIDNTNAKIVLSSSWRHSGLKEMKEMWQLRNLPGEIIDITPNEVDVVNYGICKYYDEVSRGHEIKLWLTNNKVDNYCIIDDDDDMLEEQLPNFIKTINPDHEDSLDIGYGLTKQCAEKAIQILNN